MTRLHFALLLLLGLVGPNVAMAQDNSCQYANDLQCDEDRYGGLGACDDGTDTQDCGILASDKQNNSCATARDTQCDEPRYVGTLGTCVDGSDRDDCAAFVTQRNADFEALLALVPADLRASLGDNSCKYAFDRECDDASLGGNDYCAQGTDAADCRPLAIGGDDSCQYAGDGTCDEPRDGAPVVCALGSDITDCGPLPKGTTTAATTPAPALTAADGNDTCEFARDNECDDARYGGTGACSEGTDATDCRILAAGGSDDSCGFARDGECDEPRQNGTGSCVDGSDTADCQAAIATREAEFAALFAALSPDLQRRLGDNSCQYAYDGECDDPTVGGSEYCGAGTDAADCRAIAIGGEDSCSTVNNGTCEETRYGGDGTCTDGTDASDCNAQVAENDAAYAALLAVLPSYVREMLGNDSCRFANDLECDDLNFGGTGSCDAGTDAADCRALAAGGEDSCEYANDSECDEPGIGTAACGSGTDTQDCQAVAFMRNRDDSCDTAFDGQCNEPDQGDGTCQPFSDTADCIGRGRPAGLENHYFGRDDRILVDSGDLPWRAIGRLEFEDYTCTGTLVGPRVVLTAAHCLTADGEKVIVPLTFSAGFNHGGDFGTARGVSAVFAPSYDLETALPGGGNGEDWGIVILDRDLGTYAGTLPVHLLTAADLSDIGRSGLLVNQAGYSADTGNNLSGNIGCRITRAFEDNSVLHECDTAHGDSGSPFLLKVDGGWEIIAVDSQFFDSESKNSAFTQGNLAVDSRAFYDAVQQALAQQ